LSQAIARLAQDAQLRQALAANARERVSERFMAEPMADRYLDIYRRVVAKKTSAGLRSGATGGQGR
jgi:glycosyltransferase involved in cell wall biosynthesis